MLRLSKNIKLFLNYVVGPAVFLILIWSIYLQIKKQPAKPDSAAELLKVFSWENLPLFVFVLALMLANWSLEARKWQLVIGSLQKVNFKTALKAIFTGNSVAFFTPNRVGEYFGRMVYVEEGKRAKSIAVTVVCSIAQLIITFVFGLAGLVFFSQKNGEASALLPQVGVHYGIGVVAVMAAVLILLYFRLPLITRKLENLAFMAKIMPYIKVLELFNATVLFKLLSLSSFRYIIFIIQYYILFRLYNVDISLPECFISISMVFLIMAIVPTLAVLSDLGIRWKASMELVSLFSSNYLGIMAASFTVWLVNLVIPAAAGGFLLLGIKLFNHKRV